MAEPPQAGSIVRREDAGGPPERQSVLGRLGLGEEPSKRAPYLRAILAGLKDAAAKQLEQIPVAGPFLSGVGAALLELSSEEDDAVFEKRLAEILDTGRQSREMLEVLGSLSTAILLQQNVLLAHLMSVGLPAQREQLTSVALSTALAAYRGRVARDYQYADHRGIEGVTRAEHTASLPLDEVYILPRLVPERDRFESREREAQLRKDLFDNEDLPPAERAKREEEFAFFTGERWRAGGKEKASRKSIGEALASTRHAVVIGSPGVGKSAMTRFLARTCALGEAAMQEKLGWAEELTPVVLPLAAYADAKSRQSGLKLQKYLKSWLEERGGGALRKAVFTELRAGRVLILFDGVDEIPDSRDRELVVRAVEGFLADYASNRFLVTSRPYGYVRLAGEIAHFQLPNFSPEQVEEFVRRWQRTFERWRHPEAPDFAQADKQAGEVLEEIQRNPKVEELASNPLMLVIFALIRHEQARLPEERVQLYNRAVSTLMDSWNRGRCLAGIDVGGARFPLKDLVRVWSAVAAWTRETKPRGVHRAELTRKLVEILRQKELDEDDPEKTAESYLNAAADRAGLLEELAKDIFGFWHPTFEEFLAAVDLTTPSSRAIMSILPLRDDPRWREAILLAVGYLDVVQKDQETATDLVRALWKEAPGPLEPLLHSHLLLAAACVAEDVGVKRSLAEEVILKLAQVVRDFPYSVFVDAFVQAVRGVPRLRSSPPAVGELKLLASHGVWEVRMEVARLLGNVAAESSEACRICQELLKDPDPDVRCHAAFGLLRSGLNSAEAWEALAEFRSDDAKIKKPVEDWLSTVPPSSIAAFLKPWLTSPDGELRWRAASTLSKLGGDPVQILSALDLWLKSSNCDLRWRAASVLSQLEGHYEKLVVALDPLLTDSDGEWIWRAAFTLNHTGRDPGRVLSALKPLLMGPDGELRLRAVTILRRIQGEPSQVFAALEPWLSEAYGDLCLAAAKALGSIEGNSVRVLSVLEVLLTGVDDELRLGAASVLMRIGGDPAKVRSALEPLLETSSGVLRLRAASTLQRAGCDPVNIISALDALLIGPDGELCMSAAYTLMRVGGDSVRVLSALEPWFVDSKSGWSRRAADLALELNSPRAVEFFVRLLDPNPLGSLTICQKVLDQHNISEVEGRVLSALVRVKPEDTGRQREARFHLFNWLYSRLQPQAPTLPTA